MKTHAVHFTDEAPSSVTVELTVEEAAYLVLLTGKQTGTSAEEILPGCGATANGAVYDGLDAMVFIPYYDDGVTDYLRERGK